MKLFFLIFLTIAPAKAGQLSSQMSGLVSLWHFNETSGSTAFDTIRGTNGASFSGSWVTGRFGNGIKITGANQFVLVAHNAVYNIAHPTVAAWVYQTGTSDDNLNCAGIVVKDWSGEIPFYLGSLSGEGFGFHYYVGGTWYSAKLNRNLGGARQVNSNWRLPSNRWFFLTGTYDGKQLKLYINGRLEASTNSTTAMPANTSPIDIGEAGWADYFFNGIVDEVPIFNRPLPQGEIQRIFTEGLGRHSNVY